MAAPTIRVPLGRPVIVDGVRHAALYFRAMKRRDLKAIRPGFDGEVGINITARLAGVPVAVIYALDDADMDRAGHVTSGLLG